MKNRKELVSSVIEHLYDEYLGEANEYLLPEMIKFGWTREQIDHIHDPQHSVWNGDNKTWATYEQYYILRQLTFITDLLSEVQMKILSPSPWTS